MHAQALRSWPDAFAKLVTLVAQLRRQTPVASPLRQLVSLLQGVAEEIDADIQRMPGELAIETEAKWALPQLGQLRGRRAANQVNKIESARDLVAQARVQLARKASTDERLDEILLELLAAAGDAASALQDEAAREAYLSTARRT